MRRNMARPAMMAMVIIFFIVQSVKSGLEGMLVVAAIISLRRD
jgi:hypothetical protein